MGKETTSIHFHWLTPTLLCSLLIATTTAPQRINAAVTSELRTLLVHVVDANGNPVTEDTDPDTPIYRNYRPELPPIEIRGHHVTLGEWLDATGKASIARTQRGSKVTFDLTGLIPGGVYSGWSLLPPERYSDPPLLEYFQQADFGALGINDGSQAAFTADESGNATFSVVHPPGRQSMMGVSPDFVLDGTTPSYIVSAVYHLDGIAGRPTPGRHAAHLFAVFSPVPEPSCLVIVVSCVVGLLCSRQIRASRALAC